MTNSVGDCSNRSSDDDERWMRRAKLYVDISSKVITEYEDAMRLGGPVIELEHIRVWLYGLKKEINRRKGSS